MPCKAYLELIGLLWLSWLGLTFAPGWLPLVFLGTWFVCVYFILTRRPLD